MAGIAGILSSQNHDLVPKMLERIGHRGTTQPKIWNGSNAAIGTLGISALDEALRPTETPSGLRALVWDGRLINNRDLRKKLTLHEMDEDSEVETVLHLYEEKGTQAISQLDGEFAMVIVDGDRLLMARDRLGVRPLYYGFSNDALCFASEVKAIVDVVDTVLEFPSGCYLLSNQGIYPYQPYLPEPILFNGAKDSAEQLGDLLDDAVTRCIPGGVNVGVWLSGGVDSSIVAAIAQRKIDHLYTFSVGVDGASDLEYAQRVASHIGSNHHTRLYDLDEALEVLDDVIYHLESFDAPLVRSTIGNYLVAGLAADHVPFVLSGEGGDELFAGYDYQKEYSRGLELTLSVQETMRALHNTALQRVDRSAAAHKTRAGLPFLDPRVVRYALALPSQWKIRGPKNIEKWPLRHAFADALPDDVIWREKVKFWQGAGASDLLTEYAENEISDHAFQKERDLGNGFILRSKEELLYYRSYQSFFGDRIRLEDMGRTQL